MAETNEYWSEGNHDYHSFLLRCWQEDEVDALGEPTSIHAWRFSLAHLGQGQIKKGFSCLDDLVAYLVEELIVASE